MEKSPQEIIQSIEFMNNPIEEINIMYSAKELIPHLICPICRGLVREPIMGCSQCTIYGCGVCIANWETYNEKKRCLNGCSNPNFKKVVNPVLKTILDYILIKCPNSNNSNNFQKCKEFSSYKNYLQHIETCQYKVKKCMYSSCSKRQIIRLIKEHEKECKQKNPQIYFIFRHQEKIPMRIQIDTPMKTGIEQFLELLSDKVGIPKKNIELVIIKNHEIVEYIQRRNVSIQYLAVHDGFLFGFQKYSDSTFQLMEQQEQNQEKIQEIQSNQYSNGNNNAKSNKQNDIKNISTGCQIHLELLIISDVNKFRPEYLRYIRSDTQRCPSYTRVFHFSQYQSFKDIHLEIYGFFKPYLKSYYLLEKEIQSQELPEYFEKIDFSDFSQETLEYEYQSFFLRQTKDKDYSQNLNNNGIDGKGESLEINQYQSELFNCICPLNDSDDKKQKYLSNSQYYEQSQNQIQTNNQKYLFYNQYNLKDKPFFQIVFKENMSTQLPYSSDKYFHDFYKLSETNETQFVLALILAPCVDIQKLKLNRCVQAPQTLTQMKRLNYMSVSNGNNKNTTDNNSSSANNVNPNIQKYQYQSTSLNNIEEEASNQKSIISGIKHIGSLSSSNEYSKELLEANASLQQKQQQIQTGDGIKYDTIGEKFYYT